MSPDDEDEVLRSVAIQNARSISVARRRAEQELVAAKEALEARTAELEQANQLNRTIMENATSALLMLDEQGLVTYMNPAAIQTTGFTPEELASGPIDEILHAPPPRSGHTPAECAIRDARIRMLALEKHHDVFVRRDGSDFPVSCSLSPLHREGRPAGAVFEFRDITEEQLAQKGLVDAHQAKDEFFAALSHELRTPMTSILGWARILEETGPASETAIEAIEAIRSSASVQASLIDDLMDVSRIITGKLHLEMTRIDLRRVVEDSVSASTPVAASRKLSVVKDLQTSPVVLGDARRLGQVVHNLLSNAIKFTPIGGMIEVRLTCDETSATLAVRDTGQGIPREFLSKIFNRYTQWETGRDGGLGIGLSIVCHIVECHGGSIRADSEGEGKGSVFTVSLPLADE